MSVCSPCRTFNPDASAMLDAAGATLWNPTSVIRWNLDKHYLREIAAAGVAIPGTAWFEVRNIPNLQNLLEERGWTIVPIGTQGECG